MHKKIILLILLFFLFHFLWENLHEGLYDWDKPPLENNSDFKMMRLMQSTIGDVWFLFLFFVAVSLFHRGIGWIGNPSTFDYLAVVGLGLIMAISMELYSVGRRWNYLDSMPVVFGVGISPLIQLALTGALALFVVSRYVD
jgi:hypothetical protein